MASIPTGFNWQQFLIRAVFRFSLPPAKPQRAHTCHWGLVASCRGGISKFPSFWWSCEEVAAGWGAAGEHRALPVLPPPACHPQDPWWQLSAMQEGLPVPKQQLPPVNHAVLLPTPPC